MHGDVAGADEEAVEDGFEKGQENEDGGFVLGVAKEEEDVGEECVYGDETWANHAVLARARPPVPP